ATLVAGLCGGVVQNTPYIGHPADKAMGARSGYTLATGLVIGVGAMVGGLSILVTLLPEAAVAPILVFIGLAITAQAFLASPPRHGPAVALTFVPVAAAVVLIQLSGVLGAVGKSPADLRGDAALTFQALLVLGNGFILTAVLWGWALVTMIDRRFLVTAAVLAIASLATLVGLVHSPLPGGALFWPWAPGAPRALALPLAGAYGVLGALMTRDVILGVPQDDLESVGRTMTDKHIRHLPVVDQRRLVGIISIGDVVKAQRDLYRGEVENLQMELTEEHGRPTGR